MLTKITLPINEHNIIHPLIDVNNHLNSDKIWLATDSLLVFTQGQNYFCRNLFNNRISKISQSTAIATYWDNFSILPIWRFMDVFQQNSLIVHLHITKFIIRHMSTILLNISIPVTICGIGGEFYRYFILTHSLLLKGLFNYIGISNSQSILDIAKLNLDLYRIPSDLYYVNYNNISLSFVNPYLCIINLSSIPLNLYNELILLKCKFIILIICNHKAFNNKRHLLESKYKLRDFTHVYINQSIVSTYIYIRSSNVNFAKT